jgi:hypothetical protein
MSMKRQDEYEGLWWEGRCWADPSPISVNSSGLPSIRVVSYRVMANYKTAYVSYSVHKAWENRSRILLREIQSYAADIVCLQDVDMFQEFWYPKLMLLGYDVLYKKRTQVKEYRSEGVLIGFKRNRFQLIRSVEVELNDAVKDTSQGTNFRERCQSDDVALITFLQPTIIQDLPCGFCVVSTMLHEVISQVEVRSKHLEYLSYQIERSNQEFHYPVFLAINLNDQPASPAYTLLRTGRVALTAQIPGPCTRVTASATSRSSAMITWLPPKMSIADPAITQYILSWRPAGSSALSFSLQKRVSAGDVIHYVQRLDEKTGKLKMVADDYHRCTITNLASDCVYEFAVCAVNSEGIGLVSTSATMTHSHSHSESSRGESRGGRDRRDTNTNTSHSHRGDNTGSISRPIVLPNPVKAGFLPPLISSMDRLLDLQQVRELNEREIMLKNDWNVHVRNNYIFYTILYYILCYSLLYCTPYYILYTILYYILSTLTIYYRL